MRLPHGTAKKYTARWPDGYDYAVVIKNPHDPKYGLEDAEKPDEAKDEQVIPPSHRPGVSIIYHHLCC